MRFSYYQRLAPNGKIAVPRPEHFVPLIIVLGSSNSQIELKVIYRNYDLGSLSYLSLQF
ncbi:MAG TPA: hypothetical protein VJ558_08650 [Bacillales bacterium]|nr:hypothetical protein [Bacillales bacterium]